MKKKIVIVALCVVVVAIGTLFGILKSGANVGASEQQSSVTSSVPSVESSNDIGALFPKDIQITYSSFAPLITEDQAVATAQNWLSTGFNYYVADLPVDATVALFSGNTMLTDSSPSTAVNDVQAWIVVIKQVPMPMRSPACASDPTGPPARAVPSTIWPTARATAATPCSASPPPVPR